MFLQTLIHTNIACFQCQLPLLNLNSFVFLSPSYRSIQCNTISSFVYSIYKRRRVYVIENGQNHVCAEANPRAPFAETRRMYFQAKYAVHRKSICNFQFQFHATKELDSSSTFILPRSWLPNRAKKLDLSCTSSYFNFLKFSYLRKTKQANTQP